MTKYTVEQQRAVDSRDRNLLVSAAAGSGKTRVLVGRVLSRIERERVPLSSFLIITFTRAAAAELRERIFTGLSDLAAQHPNDVFLRRQLVARSDSITTIDGLCSMLLREFSHVAGVGDFRVADNAEAETLRATALENALESVFSSNSDNIKAFVTSFPSAGSTRATADAVSSMHTEMRSHPFPEIWEEQTVALYSADGRFEDSVYGKLLSNTARQAVMDSIDALKTALETVECEPSLANYLPSLQSDLEHARTIFGVLDGGSLSDTEVLLTRKLPAIGMVRGGDEALKNNVKNLRDVWKSAYDRLQKLLYGSARFGAELAQQQPVLRGLFEAVKIFDDEYTRLKAARGVLDFSDLGLSTVRLLSDSGVTAALNGRYTEVLVDEFQDTNGVQTLIVETLASSSHLFMVGDVKQSIYRFRLAKPEIFLERYNRFPKLDDAPDGSDAKVVLSQNFRSRPEVLDSANYFFSRLMRGGASELEYGADERLYAGRTEPRDARYNTEFYIVDAPGDSGDEDDEPVSATAREAAFAARRVHELLDEGFPIPCADGTTRPATPSDIAILLRSGKDRAYLYEAALASVGVAAVSGASPGMTAELSLTMSLLRVIDNPFLDVPLIGVLASPLYGFSPDELAAVRAAQPYGEFYGAVVAHAQGGNEKCAVFLASLEAYRDDAARLTPDRLLLHIYAQTGIIGLFSAMRGGAERRENLHRLYAHARQFASSSGGLSGFISYMDSVFEHGGFSSETEGGDGVRITTVHKSKGLEYPIVLLCGLGTRFNLRDNSESLLLHPTLGAGIKYFDSEKRITYPSGAWLAINEQLHSESLAEELRILYVAMTRAREKLILTCAVSKPRDKIAKYLSDTAEETERFFTGASSPMRWLIPLAARHPSGRLLRDIGGDGRFDADAEGELLIGLFEQTNGDTIEASAVEITPSDEGNDVSERVSARLHANLSYVYRGAELCRVPSKLTATSLKGLRSVADYADDESAPDAAEDVAPEPDGDAPRVYLPSRRPRFITGVTKMTPAERGIALHLAMQYINFDRCATVGDVRGEVARMRDARFLTDAQAAAANRDADRIVEFFASPLGKRLSVCTGLWREFRFSILDDAARYFPSETDGLDESVLLQGVCDLFFEEDGELVVVDFKSDYVTDTTVAARAAEYVPQIDAYARALERVFGKPVKERILYFFTVGKAVSV